MPDCSSLISYFQECYFYFWRQLFPDQPLLPPNPVSTNQLYHFFHRLFVRVSYIVSILFCIASITVRMCSFGSILLVRLVSWPFFLSNHPFWLLAFQFKIKVIGFLADNGLPL